MTENPFYILGLTPTCTWQDIEREGQKILGMLTLGLSSARVYDTPWGQKTRSPEQVRAAMAELRDPERRIFHELWAALPAQPELVGENDGEPQLPAWPAAFAAFGWRQPPL